MSPSERSGRASKLVNEAQSQRNAEQEAPIPPQILQQADDAAAAANSDGHQEHSDLEVEPPIEEAPPPPYSASQYGEIDINENGLDTGARVARDGRVDIKISSKNKTLTTLLRHQLELDQPEPIPEPEIPDGLGYISGLPPPPMNIVIQIVGSRGDVQPFVALGLVLKNNFNHRVRIATHPVFKDFIMENGLEFFSIGGDPAELMAFMVKNPGLMPGMEAIRSGDIGKRRKGIYEMINGCWRSSIEPGDGTGIEASDEQLEGGGRDSGVSMADPTAKPFVADAIIANPPSFAHIHIAEKLGVPLHLMFTMPWSPTQSFPHPLANIVSSNTDAGMTNFLSYILVDLLTWQGIGDVVNRFREKTLRLEPLSILWAPGNLHRLRIPWTYCWSPALIPKPSDWKTWIDISGFYFLNQATNYVPEPDLDEFLNAGPPPVYIGFGSIVVDDPNAMTKLIFEAVKKTGQRALVSKGWGGLSSDEMGVPEGVFMLGNCPHDWLFKKVSCVVHHGGAGTTAAGIAAGRPTIIVPFFGDQQFWGQMCQRAGAGPDPIPYKELTADKLAEAINFGLKPDVLDRANEMRVKIEQEDGSVTGADSFHRHLSVSKLRCSICPGRVAVWQYKKSNIRLSALAATVLANEGLLEFSDLRLFRAREYVPDSGPPEPISGGAAALIGSIGSLTAGVADYPTEILKSFKKGSSKPPKNESGSPGTLTPTSTSASTSVRDSSSSIQGLSTTSTRSETNETHTDSSQASVVVTDGDKVSRPKGLGSSSRTASDVAITSPSRSTSSLLSESSRTSGNPSEHRSGSSTPRAFDRSQSFGRAQQITMDSVLDSAKATGNIVAAGMKSPLDFTMSIAQGFHNAPKLYGDKTVRPTEKVTGFHSGLKAAGKEFGFGLYDGIAGLVTQPLQGAKEEGFAGFSKGLLKGSMGLVLKPSAAMWGLPGYTMKGVYAEIVKNFGKSTSNYIIAARTAQGYEDWKASSEGERERIAATWKSDIMRARATSKWWGNNQKIDESNNRRFYGDDGELLKGFKATKHLSLDDRKALHKLREEAKGKQKSTSGESLPRPNSTPAADIAANDEFEQAIRTAVQQTSNNNPEEDARIERAIRASVREIQRKRDAGSGQPGRNHDEDEAYNRAIGASIAEYQRPDPASAATDNNVIEMSLDTEGDDEAFTRALAASLEESRRAQARNEERGAGLGFDTEDDEEYLTALEASQKTQASGNGRHDDDKEYRRAIEESQRAHTSTSNMQQGTSSSMGHAEPPPDYEQSTGGPTSSAHSQNQARRLDNSMRKAPPIPARHEQEVSNNKDDDEEFHRTLQSSEQEAKQREIELEKQRAEEDIVLEYVKKQSLAEEEYRKKRLGQ